MHNSDSKQLLQGLVCLGLVIQAALKGRLELILDQSMARRRLSYQLIRVDRAVVGDDDPFWRSVDLTGNQTDRRKEQPW